MPIVTQCWEKNLKLVIGGDGNKKMIFQALWVMMKEESVDKVCKRFPTSSPLHECMSIVSRIVARLPSCV
jgi:hypothetical protein